MLNVQNTRYMSHVNYIEHVQIKSLIFLFVKIVVRRFASHISLQEKRGYLVQCLSMHVLIGQTLHKNEEIDMFLV